MAINTIIVDDEKPARDELAFLLRGFPEINVIGQGKNGVEAVSLIKEHSPDLVFLDVKMPGLDGFGVLKKIVERKMKMPHVVYASIDGGSISVMSRDAEGTSNYRTLDELGEALDSESFWKPHRSFLVNIHHIKEVLPWFNATFMLKMDDKKRTQIPVSRSQIKRMKELFKL